MPNTNDIEPPGDAESITISVIIPVYNAAALLRQCLEPLVAMHERGDIQQLIVADDGSDDDSAALACALGADVASAAQCGGPAAARNRGAVQATGTVLWFVDADVVVAPDSATILRDVFSEPRVSAVFGCYDDHPAARNFLSQYKNLVHAYYHRSSPGQASTFWSGCGAIRKRCFDALKGFDTKRFVRPSIEDIELGYRLRDAGAQIVNVTSLRATHLKEWRLANLLHTEIFCRALPWSRLITERGQTAHDLNISDAERGRALLAALAALTVFWVAATPATFWWSVAAAGVVALANARLLGFFARQRGPWFAIAAAGFHQLYYLYSGATFVYAWAESLVKRLSAKLRAARSL